MSLFSSTQTIAHEIHSSSQDSAYFSTEKNRFKHIKSKKITLNKDAGETHRLQWGSYKKITVSDDKVWFEVEGYNARKPHFSPITEPLRFQPYH